MNVYLMKFYDEYEKFNSIKSLEEFTLLTFPKDGTDRLFIGCVLILITNVYRTRVTAEALSTVVLSVKEKIKNERLLRFYLERVNNNKLISKYLFAVLKDDDLDKHAEMILEYLDSMSFDFCKMLKNVYKEKIESL